MMYKKISILGCGWFGLGLGSVLHTKGYIVKGSTTSEQKLPLLAAAGIKSYLLDIQEPFDEASEQLFFDCDVFIITVPPGKFKNKDNTYFACMKSVAETLQKHAVSNIIFVSSTSVYGAHAGTVNELSIPLPVTDAAKQLLQTELMLQQAAGCNTTVLRFAGLVGPARHPGRFLAGKTGLGNGQAPVNLLHLTDAIGICTALIEKNLFGFTINACTPDHPSRQIFYTEASNRLGLVPPLFSTNDKTSKRVTSVYVTELLQYQFSVTNWMHWLKAH